LGENHLATEKSRTAALDAGLAAEDKAGFPAPPPAAPACHRDLPAPRHDRKPFEEK
jgi:hypothetical protein